MLLVAFGCGPRVGDAGAEQGGDTTTASSQSSDVGTATSLTTSATSSTTTSSTTTTSTTTSSSTGTADDTSTSTTDDTVTASVGFIQDPDGGCVNLSCDVWGQDCPEGEKCVPWNAGGADGPSDGCAQSRCSRLGPDPRAPGEPCIAEDEPWSGIDDCDLGAYCWYVDEITLEGVCVALCEGSDASPTCADPALSCFILDDTAVTACVPPCDPLAPACAPGSTCVLAEANDQGPVCVPLTLGLPTGEGTECEWPNGCGDGFACVGGASVAGCEAPYCCATVCDLDGPVCGDANPQCDPLAGAPQGVGACVMGDG
jgi:hypothetical protein